MSCPLEDLQVHHLAPRPIRLFALVACAFLGSFASVILNAQEAGGGPSVRGTVLDQSGNPIEKAAVVVKNEAAKATSSATTNAEGRFEVSGLPAGVYTVEVSAPGFAPSLRAGLNIGSGNSPDLSLSLSL